MELTAEEKKLVRGFMFLSQKPILYVLNISESTTLGADLEAAVAKYGLTEVAVAAQLRRHRDLRQGRGRAGRDGRRRSSRVSGRLRPDGERPGPPHPQELRSCLGWSASSPWASRRRAPGPFPLNCRAQEAAGAIHSDLEKHFIRAETIHWDTLLAAGSEAAARAPGTLRLEGKDYPVKDGDVLNIRHSG